MERNYEAEDNRITWKLVGALRRAPMAYRMELLRLLELTYGETDGNENEAINPAS